MKPSWTLKRPSAERGRAHFGWLDSRHTFSFGEYHDPRHMGFRSLRVINEDRVAGHGGFPSHPHRDMEIFSYVLSGRLEHQDSLGHRRIIEPGQIQLMHAGHGVTHSECNPSPTEPTHFLQVWILPRELGTDPGYTEWKPAAGQERADKVLIISPDGRGGSAEIRQDADVYRVRLAAGARVRHELRAGRGAWIQVVRGRMAIGDTQLDAGDGASTEAAGEWTISADTDAEALLFDLA